LLCADIYGGLLLHKSSLSRFKIRGRDEWEQVKGFTVEVPFHQVDLHITGANIAEVVEVTELFNAGDGITGLQGETTKLVLDIEGNKARSLNDVLLYDTIVTSNGTVDPFRKVASSRVGHKEGSIRGDNCRLNIQGATHGISADHEDICTLREGCKVNAIGDSKLLTIVALITGAWGVGKCQLLNRGSIRTDSLGVGELIARDT